MIKRGEALAGEEKNAFPAANIACAFLGIEVDGFWVSMQQRSRRRGERKRKREVKLAVAHAGWRVRQGKKTPDCALEEKLCHLEVRDKGGEAFWEKVRGRATRWYRDIDQTQVVINGDEAPWIRSGVEHFGRAIYQYDRFHIARELYQGLRGLKGKWKEAQRALEANDIPALCRVLETVQVPKQKTQSAGST